VVRRRRDLVGVVRHLVYFLRERTREVNSIVRTYIMRGFRAFFLLCVCCKEKKKESVDQKKKKKKKKERNFFFIN